MESFPISNINSCKRFAFDSDAFVMTISRLRNWGDHIFCYFSSLRFSCEIRKTIVINVFILNALTETVSLQCYDLKRFCLSWPVFVCLQKRLSRTSRNQVQEVKMTRNKNTIG